MLVIKRDGRETAFDISTLYNAVFNATQEVKGGKDWDLLDTISKHVADRIKATLVARGKDKYYIEDIQNLVEEQLMLMGYTDVAKAYILYREKRSKQRNMKFDLMNTYKDIIFSASKDVDLKRENANINADTAMGTMLKLGTEGAKAFNEMYVLPEHIAEAYKKREFHIHDFDFYTLTMTCIQLPLEQLFEKGFNTGHGWVRPPQRIESYASLACIVLQCNQNEMHKSVA